MPATAIVPVRTQLERTAHSPTRHRMSVGLFSQPRDADGIGAAALVVRAAAAHAGRDRNEAFVRVPY